MTTKTINKQLTFKQAMELFKKYVSKSDSRPPIKYVHYDKENNRFVATDAHRLIRVNADYVSGIPEGFENNHLYNPFEDMFNNELKYPQTNGLIPIDFKHEITLSYNSLRDMEKTITELRRIYKYNINKVVRLTLNQYKSTFYSHAVDTEKSELHKEFAIESVKLNDYDEFVIHFNGNYILDAITAAKKLSKLNNEPLELKFVSHLRPFVLSQTNVFDILILPIRAFK
jgi:DNA polymerase III sliding clamp (beta) subunit (PCNA family)